MYAHLINAPNPKKHISGSYLFYFLNIPMYDEGLLIENSKIMIFLMPVPSLGKLWYSQRGAFCSQLADNTDIKNTSPLFMLFYALMNQVKIQWVRNEHAFLPC